MSQPQGWDFDEDLGGTFALDAPTNDRLSALEELPD